VRDLTPVLGIMVPGRVARKRADAALLSMAVDDVERLS